MKLEYLGTAACEGVPAIFCDCDTCKRARLAGGKNIRTRSQALLDRKLLLDFTADTYIHSLNYGIELSKIHTCLITHNHADHLYAAEIENRKELYACPEEGPMHFYGTGPSCRLLRDAIQSCGMEKQNRVCVNQIHCFETFEAEGYEITPLKANHDITCDPVIYLIKKDGKALLYAHDTGVFPEDTWNYLESHGPKFGLVSLDCTHGIYEQRRDGHMGLETDKEVRERMRKLGCADEKTIFVNNHFSHNGMATYDELVPLAEAEGFLVSYDGLCVEF